MNAPESANQKRKRGRRANASRNDEDASNPQQLILTQEGGLDVAASNVEESEMPEETRPRKRGRQAARSNPSSQPQPEPEPEPEAGSRPLQIRKKKRGRPSSSQPQSQAAGVEAEPATAQAKKKGRTPRKGARNTTGAQETADEEADDENEGNSSLIRRSARDRRPTGEWYKSPRGSKTNPGRMGEDGPTQEEPEEPSSPRRRGRKVVPNNAETASEATASSKQAKAGKKKGRTQNGDPTSESEQASSQKPSEKRAGRLPKASAQVTSEADADAETENEPQPRTRKKRGRPSIGQSSAPVEQESTARSKQTRTRSLLRHAQNAEDQVDEEEEQEEERNDDQGRPKSKNNRKRPPQSRGAAAEEVSPQRQPDPRGPRRRQRPRDQQGEDPSVNEDSASHKPQPQKRKRPPPPPQPEQSVATASPDPEPEPKPYRQIATQTRRVPRGTIESKWAPLDTTSISSIGSLLAASARPVLLRLGDHPTRRAQATAALGAVANRLQSKLARGLPFPPPPTSSTRAGGKEEEEGGTGGGGRPRADELEYERTVAGIRGLEAALDPLLHSVDLLRRERERAGRELDHEYRVLHALGANARAQARERKGRLRRLHVLVPNKKDGRDGAASADNDDYDDDEDNDSDDDDDDDNRTFSNNNRVVGGNAEGGGSNSRMLALDSDAAAADPEVARLAAQIADHMETMRGNLAQIDGVVPSIERSRALLVSTLLPHLGKEQLEDVMLG